MTLADWLNITLIVVLLVGIVTFGVALVTYFEHPPRDGGGGKRK